MRANDVAGGFGEVESRSEASMGEKSFLTFMFYVSK